MNTEYLLNQYIILYILYIHPTPAYRNILSDNSGFYVLYLIHVWYLRIGYLLNGMSGLKTRCHSYRCVLCGQGSLYSNIKKICFIKACIPQLATVSNAPFCLMICMYLTYLSDPRCVGFLSGIRPRCFTCIFAPEPCKEVFISPVFKLEKRRLNESMCISKWEHY